MRLSRVAIRASLGLFLVVGSVSAETLSRDAVLARLQPHQCAPAKGVDHDGLDSKVMCGYQGWFNAPGDGSGKGWSHYGRGRKFGPGDCTIDLWPDVTELDDDEKFATPFRHANGTTAQVFSSHI